MLFAISANDLPWVVQIIQNAIRGLLASLCNVIYPLMAKLYDVFLEIGSILYNDTFSGIYDRISLIIGVFMVFRVIFWLIELLVNPDGISDKEKNPGKIVSKVFISVVLLATTPRIFKIAFDIQHEIISEGVIEEIIVGKNDSSENFNMGRFLAAEVFNNFLTNNPDPYSNEIDEDCKTLVNDGSSEAETSVYFELRNYGTMNRLTNHKCLTARWKNSDGKSDQGEYKLDFSGLFAVGVGCFVTWMLLMYCISAGTRCIQLIFLQVVAPIPIMCYLTPKKDNMLSKWVKQCTTTYLDLFIRVGIISFVMLLIRELLSNDSGFLTFYASNEIVDIITISLILGLLTFAKKAPDLIQELLPKSVTKASGDFGLSWKKRTDAMVGGKLVYGTSKLATAGVATGAVTGAVGFLGGRGAGRLTGLLGGTLRGLGAGAKKGSFFGNMKQSVNRQQDVNKRKIDWANSGSTWTGRTAQRLANTFGFEGTAESFENEMSKIDAENGERKRKTERLKTISSEVGNMENRARSKLSEKGQLKGYGGELQQRRVNYGAINDAMKNGDIESARKVAQNEMERTNRNISNLISSPGYNEDNYRRWKELRDKENLTNDEKIEFKNLTTKEIKMRDKAEKEWEMANNTINKLYDGTMTSAETTILQNQVNKETEENYVSASLEGIINDDVINNSVRNVSTARNEILEFASSVNLNLPADELDKDESFNEIKNLFEKVGDYYVLKPEFEATIDDYSVVDKLKGSSKSTENDIQYHIGENERRKADIQASEEYNKAKKDRDVVGGHSGKK